MRKKLTFCSLLITGHSFILILITILIKIILKTDHSCLSLCNEILGLFSNIVNYPPQSESEFYAFAMLVAIFSICDSSIVQYLLCKENSDESNRRYSEEANIMFCK